MKASRFLAALLVAAPLAACGDNLARRDSVSSFAGDTQAQVIAAQTVNPWPKAAYRKTWSSRPTSTTATMTAPAPATTTR